MTQHEPQTGLDGLPLRRQPTERDRRIAFLKPFYQALGCSSQNAYLAAVAYVDNVEID